MAFKNYCTYVLVYQELQKSLKMKVSKPVDFKLFNDKGEEVLTAIYTHQENKKQKCIDILDEVQKWVVKGVTKKISPSKVNENINPLIKQYDGILIKLDKIDSDVVKQYRMQLANKMIDLQMQQ
jgi:peptide methionine sulfoxide reductase MsrA